jgi:hypothetical protein
MPAQAAGARKVRKIYTACIYGPATIFRISEELYIQTTKFLVVLALTDRVTSGSRSTPGNGAKPD